MDYKRARTLSLYFESESVAGCMVFYLIDAIENLELQNEPTKKGKKKKRKRIITNKVNMITPQTSELK